MLTSEHPLTAYWQQFIELFAFHIKRASKTQLNAAWSSQTARTQFYTKNILPNVAAQMGLTTRTELFTVDLAMCAKASTGHDVPLIFIESENIAFSADHEVWKLCCLAAPLKILITCVEWSETPNFWPSGGAKTELLQRWLNIVRSHGEVWPQPGLLGIIVAEWGPDDKLRFYAIAIGNGGQICQPESVIVEL
jgi:hypothetical protein